MDVVFEFGLINLINIMLMLYFNIVWGLDGIFMINGLLFFENYVGFGRFVYWFLFFDLFNKKNIYECCLFFYFFLVIDF